MKKMISFTFLLALLFFFSLSCSNDESDSGGINGNNTTSSMVLCWGRFWYIGPPSCSVLDGGNMSDPLPALNPVKVGNQNYSENNEQFEYYYDRGYIWFDTDDIELPNPLSVEIKTSLGSVSGSEALPDTVTNLTFTTTDTLQLGQSLTISWTGSNADFYSIWGSYQWSDSTDYHYVNLDTILTATSVTYAGSLFTHDGFIYLGYLQSLNGPFPQSGSSANMTGDGIGFLYYENDTMGFGGITIVVGRGASRASEGDLELMSWLPSKEERHKIIAEKLGFVIE